MIVLSISAQTLTIESDTTINFENTQVDVPQVMEESELAENSYDPEHESELSVKVKENFKNKTQNRAIDQNKWDKKIKDPKYQFKKPIQKKKKKSKERKMPKINKNTWAILAYSIVGIALALLIYVFVDTNPFTKKDSIIKDHVEMDVEDVAHFSEWDKALANAEQQGDYRKAIQVLYNETLQKFINAELIVYKREFTNNMYVRNMRNTIHYKDFARHTRIFDYVWYGMAPLSSDEYLSIKSSIKKAQSNIVV
jgi:hypothetical protein